MSTETEVAVLKEQIKQISEAFDEQVNQYREDFKEVHSRMTTMQREINDQINLTFEKLYSKLDENEKDIKMFKWLKLFNKYDLYSKTDIVQDIDSLKEYYTTLIN